MESLPAFFKVFIAAISENDLKIPPAFTQSLKEPLPKKVYLRDKYKNVWMVKVAKVGDSWYFLDGWAKFARDNLLVSGDVLVFEYYCDSWFSVIIYESSATEKNVLGPNMLKINCVEKEDHVSKDDDDDDYVYDNEGADGADGNETQSEDGDSVDDKCNYVLARREDNEAEGGGDEDDEDDDGNDVQTCAHQGIKQEELHAHEQVKTGGAGTSRVKRQKIYSGDCYGADIFHAGRAQQPVNPYFVTKVMQKRQSSLFIPREVIQDFKLDIPPEITLVDPRGREFRAKCKKWKDRRVLISGGWRSLCRVNLVTQDDICICEFVPGGGPCQFINVSFV